MADECLVDLRQEGTRIVADVLVRNVDDHTKKSLAILAGSLGVSLNTLIVWILDEAATPYDDLRHALQERAVEVESNRTASYTIPSPRTPTRPFPKSRAAAPQGALVLRDPNRRQG